MKTILPVLRATGCCLALAFVLSGCSKDDDNTTIAQPDLTTESQESRTDAFLENSFTEAHKLADEAAATGQINQRNATADGLLLTCATVTHDTTATPRLITIDFGPTNCQGADGRYRRGKILVTYTGRYRDAGTVITIGFDGYYINDNQLLGSKIITNMGLNAAGKPHFQVTVNGQLVTAAGDTASWQATRTREWAEGHQTPALADDEYRITGTASGTRPSGQTYTSEILQPLVLKLAPGCRRHFVSGVLRITPANRPARVINYGNGTCDNLATLTINGHTIQIILP